ncbi:MAG: asparagine synthase (glutamine-hydrolyzing) [Phycisphaeraceae bacterium]|nr:asparagine synthase (glutamine-hydrolyzing) [Phycisphaeraceae bacterium]
MCGILGVIFRDPTTMADETRLRVARDTLLHRGPDEAGLWIQPGAALAHRRLSVLDLTHGQQPMVDPTGRHALVYNGEVYNFAELQNHYRQQGANFQTRCDTEVVLHGLATEGPDAIHRFVGMFAFGYWDHLERKLLLVRDRLGKKPLYWYSDRDQLVFASELKAIYAWLRRKFTVDPVAVDQYFSRGYILSPRTIFKEIHKIPAGCRLVWDAKQWEGQVQPWWDFSQVDVPSDPDAAIDRLDELLTDAVSMRLVSDVPIGCLLSGGIDSTLITAIAARLRDDPIEAFTIGFAEDQQLDETPYARMVAEKHGCKWRHRRVDIGDFSALIEDVSKYHDEPYMNIAMFSMRRLAQMARQDLVVVLSGQGADELSAGYPGRYSWAVGETPSNWFDNLVAYRKYTTIMGWKAGRDTIYSSNMVHTLRRAGSPIEDLEPFLRRHPGLDRLNQALYLDVKTNLPDYLVCVEERMSMAASLEARNPMLDHRLVQYMLSLPTSMKVRGNQFKWILLELAKRYGPVEAVDRPKQGFTPPYRTWVESHGPALGRFFHETDDLIAPAVSRSWRQVLQQGQYNNANALGVLYTLMFASWARTYADTIGDWALEEAPAEDCHVPARPASSSRLRTLMELHGLTTGLATLYTDLISGMSPALPIRILGDDDGWYAWLTRQSGRTVVDHDQDNALILVIGLAEAWRQLFGENAISHAATVALFCPFATPDHAMTQDFINQLPSRMAVKSRQMIKMDDKHAVLLALGNVLATTSSTPPVSSSPSRP